MDNVPQTIDGLSGSGVVRNVIGAKARLSRRRGSGGSLFGRDSDRAPSLWSRPVRAPRTLSGPNTYTGTTTVSSPEHC